MASIGSDILKNKDNQRLNNLIVSLRVLVEGIPEDVGATATEMAVLKNNLKRVLSEDTICDQERDKAMEIYNYMMRDTLEECLTLWFGKSEQTDREIRDLFGEDVITASLGGFEHWSYCAECPEMAVALILLLDQFRRNLYRGTRGMYQCDELCRKYVKRSMKEKIYKGLETKAKLFFLFVLTHSEDVEDQLLCVNEFKKLQQKELEVDDPLHIFETIFGRHLTTIQRFGRFPHRNGILKRTTTEEEEIFLADSSFRFDLPVVKTKDGFIFFRDGKTLWKMAFTKLAEKKEGKTEKCIVISQSEEDDEIQMFFPNTFCENDPFVHQAAIEQQHSLKIGDHAPDFTSQSTLGILNFHEYLGDKWGILFSYPKDASAVSTSELAKFAMMQEELEKNNCRLIGLSTDGVEDHQKIIEVVRQQFNQRINFPLVEDKLRKVSYLYGMLDQVYFDVKDKGNISVTNRSLFIISPNKKVAAMMLYPIGVGRNFSEIARLVDALQSGNGLPVATPPDWEKGDHLQPLPLILIDDPLKTLTLSEELKLYL